MKSLGVGPGGLKFEHLYDPQGDNTIGGATGPPLSNGITCTPISLDLSGSCL